MTLQSYQSNITEQIEIDILNDNLAEILKFYVLFSNIEVLSFFEFNYELNNFKYSFSIDKNDKFIDESKKNDCIDNPNKIKIEESGKIYGMVTFDKKLEHSEINKELFKKILIVLQKRFKANKNLLSQEAVLDIYIITDDSSIEFANSLKENLNILINAKIRTKSSISSFVKQLNEKTTKSIIIYTVCDNLLLKDEAIFLDKLNEFLIVIGPDDYDLSLYCGQLDVFKYISKINFLPEHLKNTIIEVKSKVQNKNLNKNKIISLSGISGGIGTTTISMNMANLIALNNPTDNVLYIDLSKTKAISNLFLEKNPLPQKTIIDLVNSNEYDIEKNLQNGLVKIRENFYSINGIQKHIDNDFLEQDIFIGNFLKYVSKISESFNYIIIDTATADATSLNTTIYDISNELWILTEMSLPHISKLKTFFTLMKRAGLKDKLTFVVNRYNSANAISVTDVESILNTTGTDTLSFQYKIPNDYETLGYCWNYCELATSSHPNSIFSTKLEKLLASKNIFKENKRDILKPNRWLSFFNRG